MKRVGFLLKMKPEKVEEYKKRHKAVWPEMLDALHRIGWHNYSLFMRDDGLVRLSRDAGELSGGW